MNKLCLVILDGYGINEDSEPKLKKDNCGSLIVSKKENEDIPTILRGGESDFDAVLTSTDSRFRDIVKNNPHTLLYASGSHVGLPDGQMGNSEVGHLNIGAGHVVFQDLARINKAIETGAFYENEVLCDVIDKSMAGTLHLIGLCSNGGVHSDLEHIKSCIKMCAMRGQKNLNLHFISDGRDTDITSGLGFAKELDKCIKENFEDLEHARISSLSGRFYAMDREKNWERTESYYNAIANGECEKFEHDIFRALQKGYDKGVTDEFMEVTLLGDSQINSGDSVIFFDYRADRMRQLVKLFIDNAMGVELCSFTEYDETFNGVQVAFPNEKVKDCLSERIANLGLKQLKVAETTKYAHVTYFLNGGEEKPFDGEDRVLVDMADVLTFDLAPRMSADKVASEVIKGMDSGYDFIAVNFANCDMVGHTGVMKASEEAVNCVTSLTADIVEHAKSLGYIVVITADHGNCEIMKKGDKPITTHTTNRVPFVVVNSDIEGLIGGGALCDITPTIMELIKN